jgi:putative SOS response-associated peptidase YedK
MCGRFVAISDLDGLIRFFTVDERQGEDIPPSWNVAPTDPVNAVAAHGGRRVMVTFRWGLVPAWAKDRRIGSRLINARGETAHAKPAFAAAFARRRCLIPADGFYEWERRPDGVRLPFHIARRDGDPLAFAGLWTSWRDPGHRDAPALRTCVIVTTTANATIAPLHDRMPVLLSRSEWDRWLDPETAVDQLQPLLVPAADDALAVRRVSTDVNSVRNNHPGLLDPLPRHPGPSAYPRPDARVVERQTRQV